MCQKGKASRGCIWSFEAFRLVYRTGGKVRAKKLLRGHALRIYSKVAKWSMLGIHCAVAGKREPPKAQKRHFPKEGRWYAYSKSSASERSRWLGGCLC